MMNKMKLGMGIAVLLVLVAMTGTSFAAASLNAGNTTVAAELISPTAALAATAVNTAYQPAGAVAATSVIRLSLTNGLFTAASNVDLCDPTGASMLSALGVVPAAPNNTYVDLTLAVPLSSGVVYNFQPAACVAGTVALNNISIPMGSVAGTVLTMTAANQANPADTNIYATATVVTVVNQFSAVITPVTSKLDFATNRKTFVVAGAAVPYTPTATQSEAAIVITSDQTINQKVTVAAGGGACQRIVAAGDSFKFKVTGDLAGLSNIKFGTAGAPAQSYTILAADRTAGFATQTIAGNNIFICYNTDTPPVKSALELTAVGAAGTTSIASGNRTVQLIITGGGNLVAGYTREIIAAGTLGFTFGLDAKSYYIPLIKTGTSTETYIKFQSKSAVAGTNGVSVDILAKDGSLVTYNAGSITAGTPLAISGTQLAAAVTAAGKTVDGAAGFAAIVTVNATEADTFPFANICDATGCKSLAVKTVGGTIVE